MKAPKLFITLLACTISGFVSAQTVVRVDPVQNLGANTEHEGIEDTSLNTDVITWNSPHDPSEEPDTQASISKSAFQAELSEAFALGAGGVVDFEASNVSVVSGDGWEEDRILDASEIQIAMGFGDVLMTPGPNRYVEGSCGDGYQGKECFGQTSFLSPSPKVQDGRWTIAPGNNAPSGSYTLGGTTSYDFLFSPADKITMASISYRTYVNFQSHRDTKPYPNKPNVRVRMTWSNGSNTMQNMTTGFTYDSLGIAGNNTFFALEQPADGYYLESIELWSIGNNARVWAAIDDIGLITANVPPSITSEPGDVNTLAGGEVSLRVEAAGPEPLSYQWYKDGEAISGANSRTLSLISVDVSDSGLYYVVVTNNSGEATSRTATVTVTPTAFAPSFAEDPADTTVTEGTELVLSAVVSGTDPISLQWRKDGVDIEGATSATLDLMDTVPADSGSYDVVITNFAGSVTSPTAIVTVDELILPPTITSSPQSTTLIAGEPLSLTVEATGTETLNYQWRVDGVDIIGAFLPILSLNSAQVSNSGVYDVVVTNEAGSATSDPATVTVYTAPEIDVTEISNPGYKEHMTISMTADPAMPWTVEVDVEWIEVLSDTEGTGDGSIQIVLLANKTGSERTGTITLAGIEIPVTQAALAEPEGFDATVGGWLVAEGMMSSPWFGIYSMVTEDGWIEHDDHGWLYVEYAMNAGNMYFYSQPLEAWLWTNQVWFPIFWDFSRNGYITFLVIEDVGILVFDYSTQTWSVL